MELELPSPPDALFSASELWIYVSTWYDPVEEVESICLEKVSAVRVFSLEKVNARVVSVWLGASGFWLLALPFFGELQGCRT